MQPINNSQLYNQHHDWWLYLSIALEELSNYQYLSFNMPRFFSSSYCWYFSFLIVNHSSRFMEVTFGRLWPSHHCETYRCLARPQRNVFQDASEDQAATLEDSIQIPCAAMQLIHQDMLSQTQCNKPSHTITQCYKLRSVKTCVNHNYSNNWVYYGVVSKKILNTQICKEWTSIVDGLPLGLPLNGLWNYPVLLSNYEVGGSYKSFLAAWYAFARTILAVKSCSYRGGNHNTPMWFIMFLHVLSQKKEPQNMGH